MRVPSAACRFPALRKLAALCALAAFTLLLPGGRLRAERPYFVTYDHQMEEPGNLEISVNPILGLPRNGHNFLASWAELEYGVKGWWTTEFYLDGQKTFRDSTVFTGFRWENRFRPLRGEHWINPVLYIEYERINEADKVMKEIVGFGPEEEHAEPNAETRHEVENEIETKLILSSNFKGWNVSENFIAEKDLSHGPWEFGYAFGVSRPLALEATPRPCHFCRENFRAGAEVYGGLGNWHNFGPSGPSHYLAPVLSWELGNGATFRVSPGFGLTEESHRFVLRFGFSYELAGFGKSVRQMFH
jgi:hypothetical protein